MMIKHLVLSGGGVWGFTLYGTLKQSIRSGFFSLDKLESIHATSIGSIVATIILLGIDWIDLDDFMIKRPWNQLFSFNVSSIFGSIERRGMFERKIMDEVFRSLFFAKDISLDITMKEFFELNQKELHFFACEINGQTIKEVDFSHITHPNWKLLDVLYCSSCLPILFSPFTENDNCYIDGGIIHHYPLSPALQRISNQEEILGIRKYSRKTLQKSIQPSFNLLDYLFTLMEKILKMIGTPIDNTSLQHQVNIMAEPTNIQNVYLATTSLEERVRLIRYGEDCWKQYMEQ
jgi:predicted acylesterase/phospholipase RssA